MTDEPTSPRWPFAAAGVLGAVAGVAAGHFVASLVRAEASPALAVGTVVIHNTPEGLKQWAIDQFGDSDKSVLVGTVFVVTLLLAVVAGLLSRRRPRIGLAFVALLGAAVIAAGHSTARSSAPLSVPLSWVWPGLVAAVAAGSVLVVLRRLALGLPAFGSWIPAAELSFAAQAGGPAAAPLGSPTDHVAIGYVGGRTARRRFLTGAAGTVGGSLLVAALGEGFTAPPPVEDISDLRIASRAPHFPATFDRKVPGITPLRTPPRDFYRIDTALVVPRLDRDRWRWRIDGLVERNVELSFEELISEFEVIERDITLNCVSNDVGGPYISSGRWVGVRTRDVLRRAGVRPVADQILSRSSDGMTISTPVQALLDDREAMIAVGLDGAALSRERGYPARLVTPGLYGFVGATKWLVGMRATTYSDASAYWTQRGWAIDAPVKTQSRIDVPRGSEEVPVGRVRAGGVAWAQGRGISRVEVQLDDGPWKQALLGADVGIAYWRQWLFDFVVDKPGTHELRVRATDGDGNVQTTKRAMPFPDGASGLHTVTFRAT
ncbi:MAG: molybdopterin-dependent oxidoreductase [Acidimicrobiales bacterium]|nr:molybdopterin-dependent oxidoreductase [Acidimicrobiales bacterium]